MSRNPTLKPDAVKARRPLASHLGRSVPIRIPLVMLLATAFIIGALNMTLSGHLGANQPWKAVEQLVLVCLIYWWYYADKAQRQYQAGAFLNVGVVALSLVAIPIYLFRSRGATQGAKAFALFIAFLAILMASLVLGGAVAKQFTP